MKKPRILSRRLLLETPYFRIRRVVANFGRIRKTYYLQEHPERVGILAFKGNSVLLVSQYRFLAGRPCWEIPGGGVESGETVREAAERELQEEGGVRARTLVPLLSFMPSSDTLYNPTHLFIARGIMPAGKPASGEVERQRWEPLSGCLSRVRKGTIRDALTVTALLAYRAFASDR